MCMKQGCFVGAYLGALPLEIEPNSPEEAHVDIRDPHQREAGNQIAAPIGIEKLIASDDEEGRRNVVAKTVLAGKEIEELALVDPAAYLALRDAVVTEFPNHFLMRDRPSNRGDRKRQNEQRHAHWPKNGCERAPVTAGLREPSLLRVNRPDTLSRSTD